jgi:glutamate racemase
MSKTTEPAIGLFDSGIGGLTVLRALRQALPNENFIYLGDTARLPYGSKSPATIERYLEQNIRFLAERGVKAVVVACNSASSVLVSESGVCDPHALRARFQIPVYNVIEPGARSALEVSKQRRVGVLGTRATVSGGAYVRSIHKIDLAVEVFQQACPLLVPLVEEGWENDPLTNLVVYRYVSPLLNHGIDTLIMGCTHYPVLRDSIRKVVGPHVELVDSAEAIARMLTQDFAAGRLPRAQNGQGRVEVLVTDASPGFHDVAARLMRPFKLEALTQVDIGVRR